jgi:hypothetical protein
VNKLFLGIILFLSFTTGWAQFENVDLGARPISLNGAFTSIADNSQAIFYNPAGLGQMYDREIAFFYSPAPYGLTELSTAALTYCEPTIKYGTFGIGIKTYGFELYRELNVLLSYGNSYKDKIFYGLNLNFYNLKIENYNSASSFGFDFGAMAYLHKYVRWGFIAKNVTGAKIGESKEKIVQVYRTGFDFVPLQNINLAFEIEKDVKYPLSFRSGIEYAVLDYVDLRFGVGSEPTTFTGGIGLSYNLFTLDYALTKSPDLGITHQGTLSINFGGIAGKKKNRERIYTTFKE